MKFELALSYVEGLYMVYRKVVIRFFCIERLDPHATAGTGETAKVVAMDPLISKKKKGWPNGDEAPTMFRRADLYYVSVDFSQIFHSNDKFVTANPT